jgi:hypothetical protein
MRVPLTKFGGEDNHDWEDVSRVSDPNDEVVEPMGREPFLTTGPSGFTKTALT